MVKTKKVAPIQEENKEIDTTTPTVSKKTVVEKKSYVVVNGFEYKGKGYKAGENIKLSADEVQNFPINSLR